MSVGAISNSVLPAMPSGAAASGGGAFSAVMGAATRASGAATGSSIANPFGQMGTDLQSLLVQLGGTSGEARDTSAARESANSTAALHGHGHFHHHGANANEGSGDLTTDFADSAIN